VRPINPTVHLQPAQGNVFCEAFASQNTQQNITYPWKKLDDLQIPDTCKYVLVLLHAQKLCQVLVLVLGEVDAFDEQTPDNRIPRTGQGAHTAILINLHHAPDPFSDLCKVGHQQCCALLWVFGQRPNKSLQPFLS
jgi:hypothetical protein